MLRSLVVIFSLAFSCLAFAQTEILSFKYGNQITGSVLQIFEDGTIIHQERECCPPKTGDVAETPLSKSQLNALKKLIAESFKGQFDMAMCSGILGENYGAFTVALSGDEARVIYSRFAVTPEYCTESRTISKAADELKAFVHKYVRVKISPNINVQ